MQCAVTSGSLFLLTEELTYIRFEKQSRFAKNDFIAKNAETLFKKKK